MEDHLRYPLQPLYDNLDSSTYEVFESDPKKYKLYQDAIEAALIDKVPENEISEKTVTILLVGAGRGPLIRSSVNAMINTGRKIKLIVVEKNPNAIVTLTGLIKMWPTLDIELYSKDMRKLELTTKADILVSELLGSFGDNELSPECLDGAQNHLKPDGISIPCKSISFLRPIMSTKIHQLLRDETCLKSNVTMSHVSWLINFSRVYYIDHPKEAFTFVHPNHDEPIDNRRYTKLEFQADMDCQLDGFAGYFTAKLYKDIEISIHPYTFTHGMGSWYPIFFSSLIRIDLKKGEKFTFEMWRKLDNSKVWYEWRTNDGKIANENGHSCTILL